jgi:lipopolysaccharide export system protein LptA
MLLKKTTAWIFIIAVAALFSWAIFSPKGDIKVKIHETLERQKEQADLKFVDVTFTETLGGIKYWELVAKTATINKDKNAADLVEVLGTFYQNNVPVLKFSSPTVYWDMANKEIQIADPLGFDQTAERYLVLIKILLGASTDPQSIYRSARNFSGRIKGTWFRASQLNWNLQSKKLFSDRGLVLNKEEITVYAQKIEGAVALTGLTLSGNATALLLPRDRTSDKITRLTADRFVFNSRQNQISAQDHVLVRSYDTSIASRQANYALSSGEITFSHAVTLTHKDIRATCNLAVYNPVQETVTLSQRATAKRGKNEIGGETIKIDLANGRIHVSGRTKITIDEEELK